MTKIQQIQLSFSPLFNQQSTSIVLGSSEVTSRLLDLHPTLDENLLRECCEHGYRNRLEATELHPPTAAGTYQWHGTVYAAQSLLLERGWISKNVRNLPLIVSPDKTIQIAIMTGSSDTGLEHGQPENRAKKGPVLEKAIKAITDNQQLELLGIECPNERFSSKKLQLWILLYHFDQTSSEENELRMELSSPSQFNGGKITDWDERIILSPIRLNNTLILQNEEVIEPIDVPVERRTGT